MKSMSKKFVIVPRGVVELHNGESAVAGEASQLTNMREREESLEVVGDPVALSQLVPGDKVLLVDDDRTLVLRGNSVLCGSAVVVTPAGAVVAAHKVGELVVLVTSAGNVVLRRTASSYEPLDVEGAIPQIHLGVADPLVLTSAIEAYEFANPYTLWQSPLHDADVAALTSRMSGALSALQRTASSQGRYTGLVLARYAVRLWDDRYLWMSQPVMLGHSLIASSYRTTATVTTSGNTFTGTEACSFSIGAAFLRNRALIVGQPRCKSFKKLRTEFVEKPAYAGNFLSDANNFKTNFNQILSEAPIRASRR